MDKVRWYVGYGVLVFGLLALGISQYGSAQPAVTFSSQTTEESPASAASPFEEDVEGAGGATAAPEKVTALANAVLTEAVENRVAAIQEPPLEAAPDHGASDPMHQDGDGVFHGVVNGVDLNGRPFPAPNTLLKALKDSRLIAETRSDRDGRFKFENMLPGLYVIDAQGPAGTGSQSARIFSGGAAAGQSFSPFSMLLTPRGNQAALAASGGAASFIPSRRTGGGGGGGSGSRPAPTSGGESGSSGGDAAAGLAALGAAAGLGAGGGGSGGGGSRAAPLVTPTSQVSEFEP